VTSWEAAEMPIEAIPMRRDGMEMGRGVRRTPLPPLIHQTAELRAPRPAFSFLSTFLQSISIQWTSKVCVERGGDM